MNLKTHKGEKEETDTVGHIVRHNAHMDGFKKGKNGQDEMGKMIRKQFIHKMLRSSNLSSGKHKQ